MTTTETIYVTHPESGELLPVEQAAAMLAELDAELAQAAAEVERLQGEHDSLSGALVSLLGPDVSIPAGAYRRSDGVRMTRLFVTFTASPGRKALAKDVVVRHVEAFEALGLVHITREPTIAEYPSVARCEDPEVIASLRARGVDTHGLVIHPREVTLARVVEIEAPESTSE